MARFKCDLCDVVKDSAGHLKKHKRTHRNDEIKCKHPDCKDSTRTFKHSGTLAKHMKTVHNPDFRECEFCQKKVNRYGYWQHKNTKHPGWKKQANVADPDQITVIGPSNSDKLMPKPEEQYHQVILIVP